MVQNHVCPYCACRITNATWTKEHMLPKALTGGQPYDFMTCRSCNNKKSALDDVVVTMSRIGGWSPHLLAGFGRMMDSPEGRKSLVAVLRHFDFDTEHKLSNEGDRGIEGDDKTVLDFMNWLKWLARGIYFLETGQCLPPKEKRRNGYKFIHSTMLNPHEMAVLRNKEIFDGEKHFAHIERWRHLPETQTFDNGSVCLWCKSIRTTGAFISLGGWYTFTVKVSRYSKRAFLEAVNDRLKCLYSENIRGCVAVDLKMVDGRETLILESKIFNVNAAWQCRKKTISDDGRPDALSGTPMRHAPKSA